MDVHLIDGTYELFRHYYAVPSTRDSNGMEVGAVRGVLASVLGLITGGATHVAVATDHVIESFRNRLWPAYKTGAGIEPDLLAQFQLLEDALQALGVTVSRVSPIGRATSVRSLVRRSRRRPYAEPATQPRSLVAGKRCGVRWLRGCRPCTQLNRRSPGPGPCWSEGRRRTTSPHEGDTSMTKAVGLWTDQNTPRSVAKTLTCRST